MMLFRCIKIALFFSLFAYFLPLRAQVSIRDTTINMGTINVSVNSYQGDGEFGERYGISHSFNGGLTFKHNSNFYVSGEWGFWYSGDVNRLGIFDDISASNDMLINGQGTFEVLDLQLRGQMAWLRLGKIFPILGPNPNSGFFAEMKGGFIQHRIFFQFESNSMFQLKGAYTHGYDRLHNGAAIGQSFGYWYFSNNNYLNAFLGVDFIQAQTRNRRGFNFDTGLPDNDRKIEHFMGLRFGLSVTFYKRKADKYFIF